MVRPRPGWLVALCAAILAVSAWLPWLTTTADGGGRANAIGGTVGNLVLPPRFGAGQLIVLLASGIVLVLGLVLIYVRNSRHPAVVFIAAVVVQRRSPFLVVIGDVERVRLAPQASLWRLHARASANRRLTST